MPRITSFPSELDFLEFYLLKEQDEPVLSYTKRILQIKYAFKNPAEDYFTILFNEFQQVDYKEYKYLKVGYLNKEFTGYLFEVDENGFEYSRMMINQTQILMKIGKDEDKIREVVKPQAPTTPQVEKKVSLSPLNGLETAGQVTIALIIKYFQVVDLLTNFFGKINIELGDRLQEQVNILNKAEFPKIGFLESMSFAKDGGQKAVDEYTTKDSLLFAEPLSQTQRSLQKIIKADINYGQLKYYNDTSTKLPQEFYKFQMAMRNTRTRLVKTNKDLFLIWG